MKPISSYANTMLVFCTRYVLVIGMLFISALGFAQNEALFKKANTLYNQEQYEEAITAYTSILTSGETSAALYYNLANAYYKTNAIGESIYYYEKGLQLSPNDEDIQNNLAFANKATIDAIESLPEGVLSGFFKRVVSILGIEGWAWVSIFGILLFVVGYLSYFITRIPSRKRVFFISAIVALVVGISALSFAWIQQSQLENTSYAIMFSAKTTVKSEPNLRSETVFELHEGTKVQVLETLNDWEKIRLADGKIGWIPATDSKLL